MDATVTILPNAQDTPTGKLADAELHFTGGALDGMKLIGFSIWSRQGGNGRHVTFPARHYTVNGDSRSVVLLLPIVGTSAQQRLRELVLNAYAAYEERAAIAS
jgi:hypothetical protein